MRIACLPDFSMELRNLSPEDLFIFRAITAAIAGGENIPWLSAPVIGGDEETRAICEDWENFVRPDLMANSQREVEILIADLADARPIGSGESPDAVKTDPEAVDDDDLFFAPMDQGFLVKIPANHVDAWYGALNQARLSIESLYRFSSKRVEPSELEAMTPETQLAFWQWVTFAATQEALLGCMEARFESGG